MDNFTYYAPTRYIFGRDTVGHAGEMTHWMGSKKVLIVTGQGSAIRSGLVARVEASLDQANIQHILLKGVKPNPEDTLVYEGAEICRREGVDGLVAVGGGSAIDTAKAIAAATLYDGDFWDFYAGRAVVEKALPLGVVLTIPAAGSEGSGNSVITNTKLNQKVSLRTDSALRPRWSILDPTLTFSLPPYQTASGIADMMAHIMERYFSPTEDVEVTDRLAEGLLMAIIEEGPKVMSHPDDYQARANIMWAATQAHNGLCGCGRREDWVSHFMEHEISALYGVTHGAGLAVVFPAWLSFMAHHKVGKVAQWARRVWGCTSHDDLTAALEGIDALKAFFGRIGLPVTFAGLGIEDPDIDALTRNLHVTKGDTIGGYLPLTATETSAIYRLML
ncbi:MAG: iron-containing alcohol dehydrogenase [Bacteroidales bacterium]|nr:iron-containing alcohol dehydrogenase [Bacteroidales bacterium]